MNGRVSLDALNAMDEREFVALLGGVFEHSPWIARRASAGRPYPSLAALHAAMVQAMEAATPDEQIALLRAHPELAGRAAVANQLTPDSSREQHAAGLDRCTPEQFARLTALNARYRERFGFPFILAVRGHDVPGILAEFETRLAHTRDREMAEARRQVARIAGLRLESLVAS